MTIKSLLHWGGSYGGGVGQSHSVPVERWHGSSSSSSHWEHKPHSHGQWKGGGKGGSNAALSALALLAFLFFLHIMQQSLNESNAMTPTTVPPAPEAVILRDKISVIAAREQDTEEITKLKKQKKDYDEPQKGDTLGRDYNDN